eukprot:jgi/Ulvmu1/5586/UM023_0123.1
MRLEAVRQHGAWAGHAAPLASGVIIVLGLPLWWCIACPTVASVLFPVMINLGCWWLAQVICKVFHVPKDTVGTVFWVAILVAMILSFASAWPIFLICQLPKCVHQHPAVFAPIVSAMERLGNLFAGQ